MAPSAVSSSGTCTLTPGLYVFTDALSIGGSKTFVANGVTLYFACGAGGTVGSCPCARPETSTRAGRAASP